MWVRVHAAVPVPFAQQYHMAVADSFHPCTEDGSINDIDRSSAFGVKTKQLH